MLYYYANSGHKLGLDRVKRGVALLKALNEKGVETRLLVNDFRAGLAAKELGLRDYVTIEGVMDIDAIADAGDSVIIDTPENDNDRLVKYCSDYKHVFRFETSQEDSVRFSETLLKAYCENDSCISSLIIDKIYRNVGEKEERVLFFLNDADYDKEILSNASFFKESGMELLLGNYFFVKYEDDLSELFDCLHEPEEYVDLIKNSSTVVTASGQTAMEAQVCGAKVLYIQTACEDIVPLEVLEGLGITIIKGYDKESYEKALSQRREGEGHLSHTVDQVADTLIAMLNS